MKSADVLHASRDQALACETNKDTAPQPQGVLVWDPALCPILRT